MKIHRKGGRPKLNDFVKKSHLISVRISEIELAQIQAKSVLVCKSISDFIRESALNKEVKPRISEEQMNEIRKLNNIGNNVFYLAELANRQGYSDDIHKQFDDYINRIITIR